MTDLIFVRHAKTDWNKAGRIQGRSDIPLAGEGIAAAREAGKELRGERIDAVFSSPLIRAVQTAEALTEGMGIEVRTDARLLERDFGEYDGKTCESLGIPDYNMLFFRMEGVRGVEPIDALFARTRSFIEDMERDYDGKTVLVVSHGVCISLLTYALTHSAFNASDYDLEYIKNLTFARHRVGGKA